MSPLSLPERWVGLSDTQPARLVEHAEQVQRNFDALARGVPAAGTSPVLPSQQSLLLVTGSVAPGGAINVVGTGGWSVARTGGAPVGDYTITFTRAFATATQIPVFTPIVFNMTVAWVAATTTTIRYQVFLAPTGALTDAYVSFHVLGPV